VQSVHRNLFKLNPAVTKYIDQMMEKRVSLEKAKTFRDLRWRGLVAKQIERRKLRQRVKELEEMEATNSSGESEGRSRKKSCQRRGGGRPSWSPRKWKSSSKWSGG